MPRQSKDTVATLGIDIGKNTFHLVGLNKRGAIVLRQKLSRRQLEARLANLPPCLIGMEACVGAHHLSRRLKAFGHDAKLMPAKYVKAFLERNYANASAANASAANASAGATPVGKGVSSTSYPRSARRLRSRFFCRSLALASKWLGPRS